MDLDNKIAKGLPGLLACVCLAVVMCVDSRLPIDDGVGKKKMLFPMRNGNAIGHQHQAAAARGGIVFCVCEKCRLPKSYERLVRGLGLALHSCTEVIVGAPHMIW